MRKMKLVLAAAATALSLTACGGGNAAETTAAATTAAATTAAETTAAATTAAETAEAETTAAESAEAGETEQAAEGEQAEVKLETPVLVTSFGQSTDAAMIDTVMKRIGIDYVYNATATGEELADSKTVVICVGASTKGLGAAGISEEEETARATAFMDAVKNSEAKIVLCHIGGETRRGGLSDSFIDLVIDEADYMVVKEDGNADGKFSDAASAAGVPITLIQSSKETIDVFTALFE